MSGAASGAGAGGLLGWWREGTPAARKALLAAALGWMLDAFDVMLFAMVIPNVIADLGITKTQAGMLGSLALLAAAGGGIAFGAVSDRFGRTRALMGSVLIYSVFTGLCAVATNLWQFGTFRVLLGIGMGGEWASGASLVSEHWPARHRGKALGLMQSAWAIGYALAALVTALLLPVAGWRGVFAVGVLPALLVVWVRRGVEEPPMWRARQRAPRGGHEAGDAGTSAGTGMIVAGEPPRSRDIAAAHEIGAPAGFGALFHGKLARVTVAVTFMNACTLFGWWGLNQWIPAYLSLSTGQGGVGVSTTAMAGLVAAMQVGMWLGYVTFGYIGDAVGRKRAYVTYLLAASVLLPLYGVTRQPLVLLALGPLVAFFGTGYYSGFGAITAELYPTEIRGRAQGFTYNLGRIASAAAPWIVGSLATSSGFGAAFAVTGAAFLAAAITWTWIPETRGRELA
ncbi:MAG: MFS transporter [Gemmatimonadetes bacterium]|nr:MFS transporter [Gemmatimonadota bacterium]